MLLFASNSASANTRLKRTFAASGTNRMSISGSQILDYNGAPIELRGINWGTWGEDLSTDGTLYGTMGANCVRIVFRWWGLYGGTNVEARDNAATATALIKPGHITLLNNMMSWAKAGGHRIILATDSNCGQYGAQDTVIGGISMSEYCTIDGNPAQNFWNNLGQRALFQQMLAYLAANLLIKPDIYEILPEPLQDYDATWAGPVRDFYAACMDSILAVDPLAIFLIGPRQAYNITFSEEAYISGRTNVIYTGNMLNPVFTNLPSLALKTQFLTDVRDTHNVPILVQQAGRQSVNDDANNTFMKACLSYLNSKHVPYTYWQSRQNTTTPDEYAVFIKDGVGGWIEKTDETAVLQYYWTQDFDDIEAAAIAAAAAAGATLFYVKRDFSNVFQGTDQSNPVTAVGQTVGRIDAVVGTDFMTQATANARPQIVAGWNGYGLQFDGSNDFLDSATMYFASGDDTTVIVSGRCSNISTTRVALHAGDNGTTLRYPYMASVTGTPTVSWRGADATIRQIDASAALTGITALVFTASKIGSAKRLLLHGAQEASTLTGGVGSVTLTRFRVGSSTTGTNFWIGPIALVCIGTTLTEDQRTAIERFGAYIAESMYKL